MKIFLIGKPHKVNPKRTIQELPFFNLNNIISTFLIPNKSIKFIFNIKINNDGRKVIEN